MPQNRMPRLTGAEKMKTFFLTRLCPPLAGRGVRGWWRVMREHQFDVDPAFWPKVALNLLCSSLTSIMRRRELYKLGSQMDSVTIPPPLFVLGHYRSGTTLLQNLLSVDHRLGSLSTFQAYNPLTFGVFEPYGKRIAGFLMPRKRIVDAMPMGTDEPIEDELALLMITGLSPYLGFIFSRRFEQFQRYLSFREATSEEVECWKSGFAWFMKRLTLAHGKPMVMKSPPHTARIRLLLEMFPDARFVHIHRDPYKVFQSSRHLLEHVTAMVGLQHPQRAKFDERILRHYRDMYDAFFEQRPLIPEGRFHEIRFADLARDPMGQMEQMYEALDLNGFEPIREPLQTYVESLKDYRKNEYEPLTDDTRRKVAQAWQRNFDAWKYEI